MKIIKIKKGQRGGFFNMLLGILGATVLANLLSRITAKCVIIAGDGLIVKEQSKYESQFDTVHSNSSFVVIKDAMSVINLNEYTNIGTH